MKPIEATKLLMSALLSMILLSASPHVSAVQSPIEKVRWTGETNQALMDFSKEYLRGELPERYTLAGFRADIHVGKTEVKSRIQAVTYYATSSEIENRGNELIYFNQGNERVTIHSAGSIAPDGNIQIFDPANVQVVESNEYNTFSDTKIAVIPIPGLSTGGLGFLDYEIITDKAQLEAPWSRIFYPRGTFEYQNYHVQITSAPGINLQYQNESDALGCSTETATITCSAKQIPALKRDETVYWRDVINQLVVTEGELRWADIATLMQDKFDSARVSSTEVDKLFKELTEDKPTLNAKISSIHRFVTREIRYNSMSGQGNAITPHNIHETLHNRYGDCKDKSALLIELLQKLDLNPFPVLVATERKSLSNLSLPTTSYFDHVIVCNDETEANFCIDATDTDTDWNVLSAWIQGSAALPINSDPQPMTLPLNKYRWRLHANTEIVFDQKGGQMEKTTRKYSGEYAGSIRSILASRSPEERLEWAQEQYQEAYGSDVEPQFSFTDIDQIAPDLVIKSEVQYDPLLDPQAHLAYTEYDTWMMDEIDSLVIDNNHYGYQFPGLTVESSFQFDLGKLWSLTFPGQTLDLQHKYGTLYRKIHQSAPSYLEVVSTLEIPSRYIPVEEIDQFNRFLSALRSEAQLRFEANTLD
ncbi:DUF3857 domain-containing protein [Microbulbifer hydrolyticus]|uniref:DUF3857 domain-containing protein n=1 Tax=Microbulbifer hydrolyticus TaxID=48074 RepID=A0A6P1TDU4_9GAMM|nr:DUF3857 domain-containing protein [Microbulbifer hydrolyticus]MBB5210016.1 hypothetical protein [Microbulbifer hydrolyticus]QHQ39459.1 DUF3857 domain-containing protein [Microbulbifer hydrolyticus]